MRLYLDDDHAAPDLAGELRAAGHNVRLPVEVGLAGKHDAIHLLRAIQEDRVVLTGNQHDFRALHELVTGLQQHHPGIVIVCKDNDRKRDMSTNGIVRAVGNLEAANFSLTDQVQILNHWR